MIQTLFHDEGLRMNYGLLARNAFPHRGVATLNYAMEAEEHDVVKELK
jgi:hypothetical protein